ILLRVDECVSHGHSREADREPLRGLDLRLGLLRGAALLDSEPLLGIRGDTGMKFLAERSNLLPQRIVLALEPIEPIENPLQIRLAFGEGGERRCQGQRQAIESEATEYHAEAPGVFPARPRASKV